MQLSRVAGRIVRRNGHKNRRKENGNVETDNAVALQGILKELRKVDNINTLPFNGYELTVITERYSGALDEAIVYMQGDNVDSIGVNAPVMVLGSLQAYKNFITGKVLVYVLAETAQKIMGEHWDYENEVQLSGALGSDITYRETPLGKHISDISVLVENRLKDLHGCYIPCIAWNDTAAMVKEWHEGERVTLKGKLQSRAYTKRISEQHEEQRTAYEVSIYAIGKE